MSRSDIWLVWTNQNPRSAGHLSKLLQNCFNCNLIILCLCFLIPGRTCSRKVWLQEVFATFQGKNCIFLADNSATIIV